ncbi:MAG TPA: tyrosine--tRNA ligase, partial [Chthoniobacteraceae bacterium]|nr:tyrosine--tRNA ligase [Chthoniobacteraceae bacterium]
LLLGETLPDIHPMEAKKQLAARIVERFHDRAAADAALADFNTRFSKKDLEQSDLPEVPVPAPGADIISAVVAAYGALGKTKSRGDVRRLVEQGSVQLRGEKITDGKATPEFGKGDVLRLDKTHAVRLG